MPSLRDIASRFRPRPVQAVVVDAVPEEVERVTLGNASAWVVAMLTAVGLGLANYWFGLPLWITVQYALVLSALILRAESVAAGVVAGWALMGANFATYLYGWPSWPSIVAGVVAIYTIAMHVSSRIGAQVTSGDQNPVYVVATVAAARAYLALVVADVTAITDPDPSWLDWLAIFVLGVVPGFPVLVNLLLFVVLNGTLIIYVVLLAKRIVNPVAN